MPMSRRTAAHTPSLEPSARDERLRGGARRVGRTLAVALAMLAGTLGIVSCQGRERAVAAVDRVQLANARAAIDSLAARTASLTDPAAIPDSVAIMLGYHERLRLGLGSPFRLMAQAERDGRLSAAARREVTWSLLSRTLTGDSYRASATALDFIGAHGADLARWSGARHLLLVDSIVRSHADPLGGERAVRLAYALASAEGSAGPRALQTAALAAAMSRDRVLSQRDAAALLRAARDAHVNPIDLLPQWRAARRFTVEAPLLGADPHTVQRRDALAARELATVLASVRAATNDTSLASQRAAWSAVRSRSPLGVGAARRLAMLAQNPRNPTIAPVSVTVSTYGRRLLVGEFTPANVRAARERYAALARTEEGLAAGDVLLRRSGAYGPAPALLTLSAAVALRTYAQEEIWTPAAGGATSPAELAQRFGLRSVTFDDELPAAQRPYYLTRLGSALANLQRTLPALSVSGLRVQLAAGRTGDSALALHDPRARSISLPTSTSAGALAHELAHDLDWQTARARYAMAGGYSTDRAARSGRGALAASVRGLTAAHRSITAWPAAPLSAYDERPAEVFARNVDWYVAAALARDGRVDGQLSAVQDELLTGYASALAPDPLGHAGTAVVRVLEDMTMLPLGTRRWFLDRYGEGRPMSALDLVRYALGTQLSVDSATVGSWLNDVAATPSMRAAQRAAWPRTLVADRRMEAVLGAPACVEHPPSGADDAVYAAYVLRAAADARARGLLRAASASRAMVGAEGDTRAGLVSRAIAQRAAERGPWSPAIAEESVGLVRNALLRELAWRSERQGPAAAELMLLAHSAACGG